MIILILLLVTITYIGDKDIIMLLTIVKNSLITLIPIIIFLYVFELIINNTSQFPFEYLLLFNISLLLYWIIINKKYDKEKLRSLYKERYNYVISTLVLLYIFFIFGCILGLLSILRTIL